MNKTMKVLLNVIRLLFVVQLLIGILIWMGISTDQVMMHMALGLLFVVLIVSFAAMGKAAGAPRTLTWSTIAFAIVTVAVGMEQRRVLLGDSHWIIRVVHLLLGGAMQAQAERVARVVKAARPVTLQRP